MNFMTVTLEMPDQIAKGLHLDGEDGRRRALEMLALEGYRTGGLSRGQVGELLGLGFYETERFLHEHGAVVPFTMEELDESSKALDQLLSK
jgi:hypothetical protein